MKKILTLLSFFMILSSYAQDQNRLDPEKPGSHVITNHPALPDLLTDFYSGARYYGVDYAGELLTLEKVVLVRADVNFLGGIVQTETGNEIWINSILPVQFPNLFKIIFQRQMGMLYGLKEDKSTARLEVMSVRWEMQPKFESWAYNRSQRHTQRRVFFEALAKKHPLKKKL